MSRTSGQEEIQHVLRNIRGKTVDEIVYSISHPKVDDFGFTVPEYELTSHDLGLVASYLEGIQDEAEEMGRSLPIGPDSPFGKIKEAYARTNPRRDGGGLKPEYLHDYAPGEIRPINGQVWG